MTHGRTFHLTLAEALRGSSIAELREIERQARDVGEYGIADQAAAVRAAKADATSRRPPG